MTRVSLTTVIVAHDSLRDLRRTLPGLIDQLGPDDESIVVDNASSDGLEQELSSIAPRARLIGAGANIGFAAGANAGARAATGELLVLLNPDVLVGPGWADAIRSPWGGEWAGWMGLVTLEDGLTINTSGGVLHFTGLGWAGQLGRPISEAPREPSEVGFLSGACLAVPLAAWRRLGGFPEQFFMYCEDVDLSLRLRLSGGRIAVIPQATVRHSYEFDKGQYKWRLLERNRWATIIRTYPGALLVLIAPALLATEGAVWIAALRGGWAKMKLLAALDLCREFPRLWRERRRIQANARISPRQFSALMTAALDSPYLGGPGARQAAGAILTGYWRVVLMCLR